MCDVFARRGLTQLFDGGIFDSPDTKDVILQRELASSNVQHSALFLGDSKYVYQAAILVNLDFLFVTGWSEVDDWESWISREGIVIVYDIRSVVEGCVLQEHKRN